MDIFSVVDDVITHPERLIITHWFNPPHLMKLIEVVCGEKTSEETVAATRGLLEYAGKKPAVLRHFIPGFIVNRIATVINRELYYMVEQGSVKQICELSDAGRLRLLKEVAGTRVYEDRRRESEAVLEDTKQKVDQVSDLISEMKTSLNVFSTHSLYV